MTWSSMPVFGIGAMLPSATMNLLIGNLNETAVAKATTAGSYSVATTVTALAERFLSYDFVGTSDTTANTAYVNLTGTTGPDAIFVSGPRAIVILGCTMRNDTVNAESYMGVSCTDATTFSADDAEALQVTSATVNAQMGSTYAFVKPLTAGTNNFRCKYRVTAGTGTFFDRRISVMPF